MTTYRCTFDSTAANFDWSRYAPASTHEVIVDSDGHTLDLTITIL